MALITEHPFQGDGKPIIYLVATPIGNLGDMSSRAEEILKTADIIACEDTRVTSALLSLKDIKAKRLVSCYSQKEKEESIRLVQEVKERHLLLAFVSDAGTPGISDPGALLVKAAIEQGIPVSFVPGPTAFTSALIMSGFDTADFSFYGFLPVKKSARKDFLSNLKEREESLIFYEAPHRLKEALQDMKEIFGEERNVCLARELTKIHEEYTRGTLKEVYESESLTLLGEFVIVIEGFQKKDVEFNEEEIIKSAKRMIKDGKRKTEISKELAAIYKVPKNQIYKLIQDL
ncbi:MAG: 16S rRNA (cytidine(1402)-2'-O)-methyltransferase [Bacilli bacterium]|jgi:16S rRNA (cytidine1402-2'-O)-methyltransferase|nr:16S rRNA (cytidine(1402)-2'-O)-methyltransferase [Bacilli bacterium]